jgi:hypothetical protein
MKFICEVRSARHFALQNAGIDIFFPDPMGSFACAQDSFSQAFCAAKCRLHELIQKYQQQVKVQGETCIFVDTRKTTK